MRGGRRAAGALMVYLPGAGVGEEADGGARGLSAVSTQDLLQGNEGGQADEISPGFN